jgi:putative ABC transport system permease protein
VKLRDVVGQAFKNIGRQKLRSALTIFAVVIGATSVTIMLALVTGAKTFFVNQFSANGTLEQIAISQQTDLSNFNQGQNGGSPSCDTCVKLTDAFVARVMAVPHVTGVARRTSTGSFQVVAYNGQRLSLNQIEGYDANGIITNTMLAGRDISLADTAGVVTVTSDYADKWGFKGHYANLVGKQVQLVSQDGYSGIGAVIPMPQSNPPGQMGNNQPQMNPPTTITATVVGVVDGSQQGQTVRAPLAWVNQMNEQQMYQQVNNTAVACPPFTPCQQAQPKYSLVVKNFQLTNGYSSLTAKVDNSANADMATAAIKKLGVGAADASSFIKAQLQIFNIVSLVLGGIGGIALFVAAIGVVNTMVMAILERTREIGVLRACGATRATIRRMFTLEAATLGFLGGVFGVAIGYALTIVANSIINKQLAGSSVIAHNIINLPLWLIASVIGIATLIGLLAGLYPAFRAARLNPIDALRYE